MGMTQRPSVRKAAFLDFWTIICGEKGSAFGGCGSWTQLYIEFIRNLTIYKLGKGPSLLCARNNLMTFGRRYFTTLVGLRIMLDRLHPSLFNTFLIPAVVMEVLQCAFFLRVEPFFIEVNSVEPSSATRKRFSVSASQRTQDRPFASIT
jgi:hypothetical protein